MEELKSKLRFECLNIRKGIPTELKAMRDKVIFNKVVELEAFKNADEILCYVSTDDEIDTKKIIDASFLLGKKVYVPKCTEEKGIMHFYEISSFGDLKAGRYNILEPVDALESLKWKNENALSALCVVPALCTDSRGYRLGYGGGYYDRFLKDFTGSSVCLCYRELSNLAVLADEYDVPCDYVITD